MFFSFQVLNLFFVGRVSGFCKDNRQVDFVYEKDLRRLGLQQCEFMFVVWQVFVLIKCYFNIELIEIE